MKLTAKILSIVIAGALLIVPAFAQTGQGLITGKVTGRDGMPLNGGQILVQRMNSQNANQRIVAQQFDTKTGKNGGYSMNGLPPGSYQVILLENGRPIMTKGDQIGDIITVADGREAVANFDMRNAPAPAAAAPTAPASKEAAEAERKELEKLAANKKARDSAFKAGQDAYKADNYEEAVKQFQIVVGVDPKQDVAWANLGNAYHKLKKEDEAAAAYMKAIELKPTDAAYQNNLGLALGAAKKLDEAKAAFEKAAQLDPTKGGDYLFNLGAMYNNNGDFEKAIAAFQKTLAAEPNNKGALMQVALAYMGNEKTMAQAEPLLQKFLTLNPTPQDKELAQAYLEAIHTTAPTEFKSEAAIADEKKKADAAAKAATAGKNTPKATTPATTTKKP